MYVYHYLLNILTYRDGGISLSRPIGEVGGDMVS